MRFHLCAATSLFLALACGSPAPDVPTAPPLAPPLPPGPPVVAADDERPVRVIVAHSDGDEFPVARRAYPALRTVDGDLGTTWVHNGTALYELEPARVTAFEIVPGFAKSAALWRDNRRVRRIRWRAWTGGEVHATTREQAASGPWTEVALEPPESLPADPWVRVPVSDGTFVVNAVEIEVFGTEGPSKYEDVCVSEVRFVGAPLPAAGEASTTWQYMRGVLTSAELGDRLEAPMDSIDFDRCAYAHEGTGGGGPSFKGTCARAGTGWRFTGHVEEFDGVSVSRGEDVDREVSFEMIGDCMALVDGWPFHRVPCP